MPKRSENALPKPRKLRNSLVAYVDRKRIVFGDYDDTATWKKFSDFCEERKKGVSETPAPEVPPAGGQPPEGSFNAPNGIPPNNGNTALIADLVTQFLEAAQKTKNPSDFSNYKKAGQALWRHQDMPTAEFDAFLLLQVQGGFVDAGYARTHCNKLVNFAIHIFKWGEVRRLAPPGKSRELQVIEPLRSGAARETDERMPVDDDVVERTLPFLLRIYQVIILLLRKTGARPSELLRMMFGDIDQTNPKTWVYRLKHHKTMRYDKKRIIAFGREEQILLAPYLEGKQPDAAVFSPKDAVSEHKKMLRDARTTPITPSQVARDKARKRNPQVKFNEHFSVGTIGVALQRAIQEANRNLPEDQQIPKWTLYQLRHAFLTEKTEQFDENVAALLAGHSDPKMVRRVYDKSQERRIIKLKQMEDEDEERVAS